MPISPLRMSVMRGSTAGTVKAFQPLEKEVYTLGSKEKAKLGGRVITGKDTGKSSDKPLVRPGKLTGGPAWQKKDQTKDQTKDSSSNPSIKPITGLKTLPAKFPGTKKESEKKQDNGFSALAAGSKSYGQTGRKAPNVGPVSNKLGYAKRDSKLAAAKKVKSSYFESSRKKAK